MARMAAGEAEATVVFVRRFQPRVHGLAASVVDDPGLAEEVAQDAFVRAWRHAAAYDPRRGRVASWLLTITRNLAIDTVRLRRDQPIDPDRLLRLPATATDLVDTVAELDRVRDALRTLPPEVRRAILLSIVHGLTAAEIAARDGLPLGTVKTRIRRGHTLLRLTMAPAAAAL